MVENGKWHYITHRFLNDNQIENFVNRAVNICGGSTCEDLFPD